MFFQSLNKNFILINWKSFILSNNFIKTSSLLFSIKLSKYALIMSIYFFKNHKSTDIAKKYIIKANILLKLIPNIWEYFWSTSFILYLVINPLR